MTQENPTLPLTAVDRAAKRAMLLRKFAVLDADGNPEICLGGHNWVPGTRPKMIFPSQAAANRFAGALAALGESGQEPYFHQRCQHWHLRNAQARRDREEAARRDGMNPASGRHYRQEEA